MTTRPIVQQTNDNYRLTVFGLFIGFGLSLMLLVSMIDVNYSEAIPHDNHADSMLTPAPGNCDCPYGDCTCDGKVQITLQVTQILTAIPEFPDPGVPIIPNGPTVFPEFIPPVVNVGPAPLPVPAIPATLVPPPIPAFPGPPPRLPPSDPPALCPS